MADSEAKPI